MKTHIFAAIIAIFAASTPLLASADTMPASTANNEASNSKTTLNCQWAPGNESRGGNWGCADKDLHDHGQ
ncbi:MULTISPECIES: hypothetical protein [unclassified Paludibacterium]|uniref:hypothetical protein n=1 Tax=unclassified Paludibacterium TaxID=2618429 RepID=UPI001C04DA8C|nr:hypothetical protein [Paludibacterium sp. B53371]BEV70911.1 hypothetical protein THUN1379_03930 [Paludibacterium sp. THUN1379]